MTLDRKWRLWCETVNTSKFASCLGGSPWLWHVYFATLFKDIICSGHIAFVKCALVYRSAKQREHLLAITTTGRWVPQKAVTWRHLDTMSGIVCPLCPRRPTLCNSSLCLHFSFYWSEAQVHNMTICDNIPWQCPCLPPLEQNDRIIRWLCCHWVPVFGWLP